jgi:hypothetical protein
MIDWISCWVPTIDVQHLRETFNFKIEHFSKTGEIPLYLEKAEWRNLKFEIRHNNGFDNYASVKFSGSIHKFHHGVNHNDYFLTDVNQTIKVICDTISTSPKMIEIHALEFGVNIPLMNDAKEILDRLILHKTTELKVPSYRFSRGYMRTCCYSQFELKIYNKGLQYRLSNNILRYEIKVNRMAYLHEKGISVTNLHDLLNEKIHCQFINLLMKSWDEIILKEDIFIINPKLNKTSNSLCINSSKYDYWKEQSTALKSFQFIRLRNRYRKALQLCESTNYHENIRNQIQAKWLQLSRDVVFLPLYTM